MKLQKYYFFATFRKYFFLFIFFKSLTTQEKTVIFVA